MDKKLTPKKKMMVIAACAAALLLFLYLSTYLTGSGQTEEPALAEELSAALSQMKGAGEVRVVIHYAEAVQETAAEEVSMFGGSEQAEPMREVRGVLIVAEGAEDIRVRTEMVNAVTALLNISAKQVEILY